MTLGFDLGNAPDWVAAIGTVGTLGVALKLLRNEMRDRERATEVADQRPANGVFAWVDPRTDAGGWETSALNRSDEPVYDAVVYLTFLTGSPVPITDPALGTIPPGQTKLGGRSGDRPGDPVGRPDVEIEFTDGRGRHWRRDSRGHLQQVDHRTPVD